MIKCSSIETLNKYLDLIDEVKFRLNEINETKHYFNLDIRERKAMSKRLNKYIADYIDETLIFYLQQVEGYQLFFSQVLMEFL